MATNDRPGLQGPAERYGLAAGKAIGDLGNAFLGKGPWVESAALKPAQPRPGVQAPAFKPVPQAPAGGIGVKPATAAPQALAPAPAPAAVATALPAYQPPPEAPKVPAPVSAQVGVKNEGHPDSPVQAPKPANWQAGQPPQWPIQPMPAGSEPFPVAQARLNNGLATDAIAAKSPVNDFARIEANSAARLNLFKQHHGGWAPGEYQQLQNQQGGIGVQAGGQTAVGPVQDPYRQRLQNTMANPGVSPEGGIGVYRGNAGDGGEGLSVAARNTQTSVTAQNRLAAYDMTKANVRQIDGDIRNRDPNTAVQAAIGGLRDPQGKALAEGQNNMPPGSIPEAAPAGGIGVNGYNGSNVGPADRVNHNVQGLHSILHGDLPLHQKIAVAAQIPGINQPGSPHQELFDAWMARQQATNERWGHEVSQYGDTGRSADSWLWRPIGSSAAGQNQARNQKFHADMARLGYKFHQQ